MDKSQCTKKQTSFNGIFHLLLPNEQLQLCTWQHTTKTGSKWKSKRDASPAKHIKKTGSKGKPKRDAGPAKLGPPYLSNIKQRYMVRQFNQTILTQILTSCSKVTSVIRQ